MLLPWIICGLLLAIIVCLVVKIVLMHISMREMYESLQEHLSTDTNQLIVISSGDKYVRELAKKINHELIILRKQRQKYVNGDRELKEAITNISHDLRTPLTAICGYLDLLENEEKSDNVARYLSYIENRTQSLKQLTEELFRYSVIISTEEIHFETVNVNGVLEESIAAFYATLVERGITPTIQVPEKKILRHLNKIALSRIFSNLLNNTIKYSDGDLDISLLDNGDIIFTNTAKNLTEVEVKKLFNRFFTVEAARNSTGLGLAISKTLVEQMNGTITAHYKNQQLSIYISFLSDGV